MSYSEKMGPGRKPEPLLLKVESALFLQKDEIAKDVLLDLVRLGFGIDLLQIHNDLVHGVFAVAALDNFETRAVQAQGALRHEQRTRLLSFFVQAAAGSEARKAVEFRRHPRSFTIPLRAGKRPAAASRDRGGK